MLFETCDLRFLTYSVSHNVLLSLSHSCYTCCGNEYEMISSSVNHVQKMEFIQRYFEEGRSYGVILDILIAYHGVKISLRSLKTHLKNAGMLGRPNYSRLQDYHVGQHVAESCKTQFRNHKDESDRAEKTVIQGLGDPGSTSNTTIAFNDHLSTITVRPPFLKVDVISMGTGEQFKKDRDDNGKLQVGCELEEKERFWSELDEVMESIPTGERVVIGADFNGHVGEGNTGDEEVMGKFGVKERNLEGQMVVDFAKRMDMGVVNTYFQKREEHRVTYKSGGRSTQKKRSEIEKKTKWWKLKKEECCEEFRQKLRQALGGQVVLPDDWETTAEVIRETGRKVLGVSSGRRKEDKETWWWNEEVHDSIQRKRLAKKKWDMDRTEENRQEYKELQRRVKREVSKAKQKAYDELYTRQRDRDGKDVQQKVDKIRKDEVRKALKRMKSGKAVGPDDIPVEVWKCLGEAAVEFLTSLFNRVLENLEKAYDRVPREELWYCMRKSGVAEKYVRVVQDMYERSRTVVRCAVVMDQLSEEVRQESPWTMMFADDIVICSESREQVEENLERWRFALERRGMKVSGIQSNGECGKEVKKRVQAETVSLRKRQESELEVAELKMLRFSLGVTRLDRIRNEYIRGTAHVGRLGDKVREARLRWFGHVQRREMFMNNEVARNIKDVITDYNCSIITLDCTFIFKSWISGSLVM
ncbi:hypothetical protein QTP70_011182 [Hemibagrus guttatus]|uniref:Reverse transcriptase domain-containing protein n=1 Tax=Hemibagrus guttatus TaxID=175788 RepID=A0AAE0UY36_9TELE|nr:hypothetical protein QTP70_011182 [Hemibagrus guttatus]